MLNIHPDAQNNFNDKAQTLISCLKTIFPPVSRKNNFNPDVHVKHHFTDKDIIGEVKVGAVDFFGQQVAFYFRDGQKQVGIEGDDYNLLRKLSENMFKIKDVRQMISQGTIEKILCDWVKEKYFNKDIASFAEYFISKANVLVSDVSVWAPISYLCVQEPFRLGKVYFRSFTRELIDKWKQHWITETQENEETINKFIEKQLRPLQGYAVATLDITAERERAKEILIEEATKAISFLRIFTGTVLHPKAISSYGLRGITHVDGINILYIKNREDYDGMSDETIRPSPRAEVLDKKIINELFQVGLGTINKLLNSESLTLFSSDVIDALLLYSRAGVSKDISDKLVYMLVALESIFLRNSSEPIQQNLSERLAFLIGKNVEERKRIISNVRDIYGLRSAFIHHGESVDNLKTLELFMLNCWYVVINLIAATDHFNTKDDFINWLDDRKLS